MYRRHFGLHSLPFRLAPDPHFHVETRPARVALVALVESVLRGRELSLLIGESGIGKTAMVRRLAALRLPQHRVGALLADDVADTAALPAWLLRGFGLRVAQGVHQDEGTVQRWLAAIKERRQIALAIIDEAQRLPPPALHWLAQLASRQNHRGRTLQIVLSGQDVMSSLRDAVRVGAPARIGCAVVLSALDAVETEAYLRQRLALAGASPACLDDLCSSACARAAAQATGGIPRRLHTLYDRILFQLWTEGRKRCDAALVQQVHRSLHDELFAPSAQQQAALDIAGLIGNS